jgi:hypothetical protein
MYVYLTDTLQSFKKTRKNRKKYSYIRTIISYIVGQNNFCNKILLFVINSSIQLAKLADVKVH